MKTPFITKINIKGIKNVEDITLNFSNAINDGKINLTGSNVKAIYGPNGSGKSAIIHAIELFYNLNWDKNFLINENTVENIRHLINFKTNKFYMSIDFILTDRDTTEIYEHCNYEMELVVRSNQEVEISKQKFQKYRVKKRIETKKEVIFDIENGKIIESTIDKKILNEAIIYLEKRSLVEFISDKITFAYKEAGRVSEEYTKAFKCLECFYQLLGALQVVTDKDDEHHDFIFNRVKRKNQHDESGSILQEPSLIKTSLNNHYDRFSLEEEDKYKKYIESLFSFMVIFKPNLKSIDYNLKEYKNMFIGEKIFNYGDYKVHVEFESAGIKKLISLYDMFYEMCHNRSILFIDELDSKINDVYLNKIIEYMIKYSKGQLVFTTHSVSPMEVLGKGKNKYSIDFMTSDGRLLSWVKNGNYSPSKQYKEGMIDGLPFNIEDFDFLPIFGEKDDE